MLNNSELLEKLEKSDILIQLKIYALISEVEASMDQEITTGVIKSTWKPSDYQAACHQLGYDPFKMKFIRKGELPDYLLNGYSDDFKKNTKELGTMCASFPGGEITVILDNVPANQEKPLLAHEIFHAAFFATIKELKNDHKEISKKFDGLPIPSELLMEYKHLTGYCTEHVIKALIDGDDEILGVTEVLSTMAEIQERTGSFPSMSRNWLKLYKAVHDGATLLGVLKR